MWTPELTLRAGVGLCALILLTHGAVVWVLILLGQPWWWLLPVVLASAAWSLLRDGLKCLPGSVTRVWLGEDGWYWQQRNGCEQGPFQLHAASRVDSRFVRLSLRRPGQLPRHLLVTAGMTEADAFRQLQVFLRWAPDKNQAPGRKLAGTSTVSSASGSRPG